MSDPTARDRAAMRLVEMLTPAATLGVRCPRFQCQALPGDRCDDAVGSLVEEMHDARVEAAGAELHALLLTLLG